MGILPLERRPGGKAEKAVVAVPKRTAVEEIRREKTAAAGGTSSAMSRNALKESEA